MENLTRSESEAYFILNLKVRFINEVGQVKTSQRGSGLRLTSNDKKNRDAFITRQWSLSILSVTLPCSTRRHSGLQM